MMKKRIALCMTFMIALLAVGCTQETTVVSAPEATANGEGAETESVEEPQTVSAVIYYGNANADGFEQKEVELPALTPENLIAELAAVNVVSIDTEVKSFEQDGKSLKLDLSRGFSNYVNMMGTSGEYIVVGGLVNTFLTAYDGEEILITVEGKEWETGHTFYDQPLNFYEPVNGEGGASTGEGKEAISYRLKDETYQQDWAEIYYPQFTDMSDPALQEKWNEVLREITVGAAEKRNGECDSYQIDYKIASCDTEFVSFVFTREIEIGEDETTDIYAISFDLVEGKNVRLCDWQEAADTAAYNLSNDGYYKVLSDDGDREAYDEAMKTAGLDEDGYKEKFQQFDFDMENLDAAPAGTSYVEDGELILIMEVPKDLGGTVEIATGIEVR